MKSLNFEVIYRSNKKIRAKGKIKINSYYETPEIIFEIFGEIFEIELEIDPNFKKIPKIFETGGKVPLSYHHFKNDNSLCLGSSVELYQLFRENTSIKNFLEETVKNYLFRFACLKKYYKAPWGEYSHEHGILESYQDLFEIDDKAMIIRLMVKVLGKDKSGKCPCGSNKSFRECHYKIFYTKASKVPLKIIESNLKSIKQIKKHIKISELYK